MSRIFDALRRAEGERPGNGSSSLPQSQELLREAERRAASDWEPGNAIKLPEEEVLVASALPGTSEFAAGKTTYAATLTQSLRAANERVAFLDQTPSLTISVRPESHLAAITDRDGPTAESVRLLAVRLRDMRRSRTLKIVVVTSTIPKEGKSTIAANLAITLARRDEEKVLLIEGDLRLPAALSIFGLQRRPGFCELIRGEMELSECVCRLPEAKVWILPAGMTTRDPLELIQNPKTPALMDQLAQCFDWIIIDSPPVLPLADTSIWMRLADGVLLVTRQGVTEKKQLMSGLEALEPQKVLGAILNGSEASHYSSYYYRSQEKTEQARDQS